MTHRFSLAIAAGLIACGTVAQSQDVRISTFKTDSTFTLNGQTFTVSRSQDQTARLDGEFARTSRACPPQCLQPMSAADGVATLGELEVLTYLETTVSEGSGLLIDARLTDGFAQGSIPGAVNVPFMTLADDNRYRDDILRALGAVSRADGSLDFSGAMALAFYSGGPWSDDAPIAITHLLSAGYPSEKLFYYRGGMQAWVHAGLTVQLSQNPG